MFYEDDVVYLSEKGRSRNQAKGQTFISFFWANSRANSYSI